MTKSLRELEPAGDEGMATDGDLEAHNETYAGFISLLKLGTAVTLVTTVVVVLLIAN